MQEIKEQSSFMDEVLYDGNSFRQEYQSHSEKLSDDKKIDLLIDHLTILSSKYGMGEVNFWYEPCSDGYKVFSIKISPDKNADELIDILDKITDEMSDFAKQNNMERFFNYSCVLYDYDVE